MSGASGWMADGSVCRSIPIASMTSVIAAGEIFAKRRGRLSDRVAIVPPRLWSDRALTPTPAVPAATSPSDAMVSTDRHRYGYCSATRQIDVSREEHVARIADAGPARHDRGWSR